MEIERKFVLASLPPAQLLHRSSPIDQGYLPLGLRLRRKGQRRFLTLKGEGTLSREEWETELPEWAFQQLWPETAGRRLEKTRYLAEVEGRTLEIDEYHGALTGLWTLECEFSDESAARAFALPEWAASARDVTEDLRYRNSCLASQGLPPGAPLLPPRPR